MRSSRMAARVRFIGGGGKRGESARCGPKRCLHGIRREPHSRPPGDVWLSESGCSRWPRYSYSVGKSTFEQSLGCLEARAHLYRTNPPVEVPAFDVIRLAPLESLYVTRPILKHYTLTHSEPLQRAKSVFESIAAATLKLRIEHVYLLNEAPQAHRDLEERSTTGKLLLIRPNASRARLPSLVDRECANCRKGATGVWIALFRGATSLCQRDSPEHWRSAGRSTLHTPAAR